MFRWLVLCLFSAALIGTGRAAPVPLPQVADRATWVTVTTADLDGDGRPDKIVGYPSGIPGAYRKIAVESASGGSLLQQSDESNYYAVLVADLGGKYPLLVLGTPFGNWLQLEAFIYQPRNQRMEPVRWDDDAFVVGRQPRVNPETQTLVVYTERGYIAYRFRSGRLHPVTQNGSP